MITIRQSVYDLTRNEPTSRGSNICCMLRVTRLAGLNSNATGSSSVIGERRGGGLFER